MKNTEGPHNRTAHVDGAASASRRWTEPKSIIRVSSGHIHPPRGFSRVKLCWAEQNAQGAEIFRRLPEFLSPSWSEAPRSGTPMPPGNHLVECKYFCQAEYTIATS